MDLLPYEKNDIFGSEYYTQDKLSFWPSSYQSKGSPLTYSINYGEPLYRSRDVMTYFVVTQWSDSKGKNWKIFIPTKGRKCQGANVGAQMSGRKCRGANVGAHMSECKSRVRKCQVRKCEGAKVPHPHLELPLYLLTMYILRSGTDRNTSLMETEFLIFIMLSKFRVL